ncbi:MAG: MOSC domain-containing protein [Alphaproteobacteria bacterium]|nr:MOSC domain-containing protein [Alphaproteobacteria bacterium]
MSDEIEKQKTTAFVGGLFVARGSGFVTKSVAHINLGFAGIAGDYHSGLTRKSGGREPWYPRGTVIRNERQLSILSRAELGEIAKVMGIERLAAEWIGGNIVLDGIANLTQLPPRTQLFFASGAVVRIDGDNGPCRIAGQSTAEHCGGPQDMDTAFVLAAKGRRGLLGWVEREGKIAAGDEVTVRIWRQKPYRINALAIKDG